MRNYNYQHTEFNKIKYLIIQIYIFFSIKYIFYKVYFEAAKNVEILKEKVELEKKKKKNSR